MSTVSGEIQWIVACLAPNDVAPHPNFRVDSVQGSELLALLVQLQYSDYRDYEKSWSKEATDNPFPEAHETGRALLAAANMALDSDSAEQGLEQLMTFTRSTEPPLGQRVAAALLAAMAASEVDRLADGLDLLEALLEHFPNPVFAPSSSALVEAVVLQQAAVRHVEAGNPETGGEFARRAVGAIARAGDHWEMFKTSQGVSWSAAESQRRIADLISANANSLIIATADGVPDSWVDLVRSSPPIAELRPTRDIVAGLSALVEQLFKEKYPGRKSSRTVFRSGDPVIIPLWAALINAELSGSLARMGRGRRLLGETLALRGGVGLSEEFRARESIRLLRQADSEDGLRRALHAFRVEGPLNVLSEAAGRLLMRGLRPSLCDLALIEMSADLLSAEQLDAALSWAIGYVTEGRDGRLVSRHYVDWRRVEIALTTAASLIPGTSAHQVAAERILDLVRVHRVTQNQSTLSGLARVAEAIEWHAVSTKTRSEWLSVLSDIESNDVTPVDVARLWHAITDDLSSEIRSRLQGMERVVALVNGWLGTPPSPSEVAASTEACRKELTDVLRDAQGNKYLGRTFSPTQLAAHLISDFGQKELWGPVLTVLTHRQVPIMEKLAALRALSSSTLDVPRDSKGRLVMLWRESPRTAPDVFFGGSSKQLEAAWLKLCVAGNAMPLERLQMGFLRSAASDDPIVRSEVASACLLAISNDQTDAWVLPLLLQLSQDTDRSVRHHAARALAFASLRGRTPDTVRTRVRELIREPGISVVLGALLGFKQGLETERAKEFWCRGEVDELRTTHPSRNVRQAASAALGLEY